LENHCKYLWLRGKMIIADPLKASMNQSGLGPCMWWEGQEGEEEEGEQPMLENGDVEMEEA
jgi:hypothetical protein